MNVMVRTVVDVMFNIFNHQPIVEQCEGCQWSGPRIVGGDMTFICRRNAYPHTKWWFNVECKNFKKEQDK